MSSATRKGLIDLEARIEVIEGELGLGAEKAVPTIDKALSTPSANAVPTLHDVYDEETADLLDDYFDSVEEVKAASDEDLLAISGIGPATLKKIRAAA